ncbi:MAG: hypothetical protein GWN07_26510, partial [Actinobacteria bacterium]|nr:hypothetical protein [Actinomycetota bacterium]NIS34165.1 hypothetical protein [Actinomycetota bacterium]NIT97278.1 hypothetical protein [Actinomycetota bacterium]NIU68946.1 hypothetical protein [Actinomycetota bacterium]NIV57475.1 hypothetical protein [Actinomycetota bacterium]
MEWGAAAATSVEVAGTGVGSAREYVWSGLTAGTGYQFQLVAFRGTPDVDAVYGPLSNIAGTSTQSPPPPPGGSQ